MHIFPGLADLAPLPVMYGIAFGVPLLGGLLIASSVVWMIRKLRKKHRSMNDAQSEPGKQQ
jgi:hypothetical protein